MKINYLKVKIKIKKKKRRKKYKKIINTYPQSNGHFGTLHCAPCQKESQRHVPSLPQSPQGPQGGSHTTMSQLSPRYPSLQTQTNAVAIVVEDVSFLFFWKRLKIEEKKNINVLQSIIESVRKRKNKEFKMYNVKKMNYLGVLYTGEQ